MGTEREKEREERRKGGGGTVGRKEKEIFQSLELTKIKTIEFQTRVN